MICAVCGNEFGEGGSVCRYCQSPVEQLEVAKSRGFQYRIVNIKQGMPVVSVALDRLKREITVAKAEGIQVMIVIHGYGSSGKGGAIREECRKTLDHLVQNGTLSALIPGEEFSRRSGPGSAILRRFPQLSENTYLGKRKKGITLVQIG